MPYLKFSADYLFTGIEMLQQNHVLITDEGGIVQDIISITDAGDDVQHFKGMLTPGFINCHCHLELSHIKKRVPEKTGLVDFLITVIQQRRAEKELIHTAMQQAEQELYNSGTIAVGDICNTTDTLSLKQKSSMQFYNFIESLGFTAVNAAARFEFTKNIFNQFIEPKKAIVPHAPYSVSEQLFNFINTDAAGKTISIHNQECAAENELYKTGESDFKRLYTALGIDASFFIASGKSSLQTYLPWLHNAKNIILVHNTFTGEEDILFANRLTHTSGSQQLFFCICPNANLYIENSMPPINLFRKNNCNIVIGTDSYASNWSLNMLDEIRTIQNKSASTIPIEEILKWATVNGAMALQMSDKIGSFEKGKQPGVVFINEMNERHITTGSSARRIV